MQALPPILVSILAYFGLSPSFAVSYLSLTLSPPDQEDEAMNRWKASLGLGSGASAADPNDPRKCVIKSLALVSRNMP